MQILSFIMFVLAMSCLTMEIAEAKVYKCVDANGKKTYSQTMCRTDGGSMERNDFVNKQPVMNAAERLMRLKSDIAMSNYYAKVDRKRREIEYEKDLQRAQVRARQSNTARLNASAKWSRDYYRNAANQFKDNANHYHSTSLRRQSSNIADHFSRKARDAQRRIK